MDKRRGKKNMERILREAKKEETDMQSLLDLILTIITN